METMWSEMVYAPRYLFENSTMSISGKQQQLAIGQMCIFLLFSFFLQFGLNFGWFSDNADYVFHFCA